MVKDLFFKKYKRLQSEPLAKVSFASRSSYKSLFLYLRRRDVSAADFLFKRNYAGFTSFSPALGYQ
jgi:hypothetical protein